MFITTLCLALYLAAVKRRQELGQSGTEGRKVLEKYSVSLVDRYAEMSATGALLFYSNAFIEKFLTLSVGYLYLVYVVLVAWSLFAFGDRIEASFASGVPADGWFKAGISYAGVTHFAEEQEESKNLGKSALENSDNLVRVLNNLIAALVHLRDAIQSQDEEKVHGWLKHAQESRQTWWEQRLKSSWASTSSEPLPSSTQILGGLFGFRPRDKKRGQS